MEILSFAAADGRHVDRHGSDFVLADIADIAGPTRVGAMHLGPGGVVGRHPAVFNQLFCVVSGTGWVAGEDGRRHVVTAGQAAFWTAGESHAAGTDVGLVAVVIEGETVRPIPAG